MGTKNNWLDNYKDPRWQKKRLEIMERDGFRCRSCGSETETLNVHHAYYEKGKMPWEYDNKVLITWCEKCHKQRRDMQNYILMKIAQYDTDEFSGLHCFIGHPMFSPEEFFKSAHELCYGGNIKDVVFGNIETE